MSKRFRLFRYRPGSLILWFVVLHVTISVGYYHIPWEQRRAVYVRAKEVDTYLMKTGLRLMQGWDELALFGQDVQIDVDGTHRESWVYGGFPSQGAQWFGRIRQLDNKGYTVGYSDSMRNPLWVTYRLFDMPKLQSGPRPSSFKKDSRTKAQVSPSDYTHSGLDRGHMAPNYGIATRYGAVAQKETFLMSNIIPQTPSVNRHLWKELEHRVANQYGRYFSEVWVTTGPVFQKPIQKLKSGVPIPSHYYKIIADEQEGTLRVMAFLIERNLPPYTRVKTRLVSIDELEELTGLNFFPEFDEEAQAQFESVVATRMWPWIVPSLRYRFQGKTE